MAIIDFTIFTPAQIDALGRVRREVEQGMRSEHPGEQPVDAKLQFLRWRKQQGHFDDDLRGER